MSVLSYTRKAAKKTLKAAGNSEFPHGRNQTADPTTVKSEADIRACTLETLVGGG